MAARTVNRRAMAAALGVLLVVAGQGCTRDSRTSEGKDGGSAAASPFIAVDPGSASSTDRAIVKAQERLRANFDNDNARLALAEAFLQKAREVGDPTLYGKAEVLLDEAQKGRKSDPGVLVAQGALALAQHRFEDALELGRKAGKAAPGSAAALGVVVDSLNELGRYEEALEATQAMVDAKPNLASLARVSYARELRGDFEGAIAAMSQAATAGAGSGENVAYIQVQLGNLLLNTGDVSGAEASYTAAERSFPGFALAKAGRARALVARGNPVAAADMLAEVVRVLPTAENAIAHGDALSGAGRAADAREAYALVDVIARLYRANGVNVDLELALFAADHSAGKATVKQARAAVENRPSIQGHDALAWALFTAGKADDAWPEARRALRTGSRDPLLRFHAAAIAEARGDKALAIRHLKVVLATNPRFSAALASRVERLAAKLGLPVAQPAQAAA